MPSSLCRSGVGSGMPARESILSVARPPASTVWFTSSYLLLAYSFRVILPHRTPMRQHGRSGTDVCTDVVRSVSPLWLRCRRDTDISLNTYGTEILPNTWKQLGRPTAERRKTVLGTKSLWYLTTKLSSKVNSKAKLATRQSEALR